jgi:hypothetical protein
VCERNFSQRDPMSSEVDRHRTDLRAYRHLYNTVTDPVTRKHLLDLIKETEGRLRKYEKRNANRLGRPSTADQHVREPHADQAGEPTMRQRVALERLRYRPWEYATQLYPLGSTGMARLLANGWVEALPDDPSGRKRVRISDDGEKVLNSRARPR